MVITNRNQPSGAKHQGKRMNIQQLRYAHEVGKRDLSVSAAAAALHTSQPGVSKQIRALEEELGVQLFVRQGRRFTAVPRFTVPFPGSSQDSSDPEGPGPRSIFRQRVTTPRVRDVRCREEKPKCRASSDLTGTETMTPKVC